MPKIKMLPQNIINRIAAGEVLERPASAVKELVENALDAEARKIAIKLEAGGKNLISITDNGFGMDKETLQLAVQRHATSKLDSDDLLNINFFGFRGEALPAIGSVAKLKITSKTEGSDAWAIEVIGGDLQEPEPATMPSTGTKVEVRDLFFATPARLKFMKAETTEKNQCVDVVKKIAMANPNVAFSLEIDGKMKLDLKPTNQLIRISELISKDFANNSLEVQAERDEASIHGYAGVPTYNRGTSAEQYVYVNGRPVKDKVLFGAIKAAYKDFLGGGRFPVLALFITLPNEEVDVNVHPAKAEVRFKDQRAITGMLISALRAAINSAGHQASTTIADFALHAIGKNNPGSGSYAPYQPSAPRSGYLPLQQSDSSYIPQTAQSSHSAFIAESYDLDPATSAGCELEQDPLEHPLGNARCQLHGTYVIAEKKDSIVIIDQHAAHERLVYEDYKSQIEAENIQTQPLLMPEILAFDEKRHELLMGMKDKFTRYGFVIEQFGTNEIQVSQIPALLAKFDITKLFANIADDLIEHGTDISLMEAFEDVLETSACHNSIRAGRKLSVDEMNELLRQMERTPHSGQCNHGRPTYVELKLEDVEKLFGRR